MNKARYVKIRFGHLVRSVWVMLVNKARFEHNRLMHLVRSVQIRFQWSTDQVSVVYRSGFSGLQIRFQWSVQIRDFSVQIDREAGENLVLSVNDSVARRITF